MKYTNKKWAMLGMSAFLALTLAACNSDEEKTEEKETPSTEQTEKTEQHDEKTAQQDKHEDEEHAHKESALRFLASDATATYVLNEKFEEIAKFSIGQSAFTLADSGRYAFARDAANKDSYTLVDTGLFIEDHGDHMHPYEEQPATAAAELQASKPAHMISHAGKTAIFHDGSGQVDVFTNSELALDNFKPSYSYTGPAHHGAAVPLSTGELAVTFVKQDGDALPSGVKIVNEAGEQQAIVIESCEGLHGTAYGGEGENEKLAFGCMGKVVLYDVATKKATDVTLPDEGARVGTVKFVEGSDYFFTNYAIEGTPQTKIGIINAQTAELKLVELPAAYKSAYHVTANNVAYVLAADGNMYEINLAKASIKQTIATFNPFNLEEETPSLFEAKGHIYAVMPSFQKVYEVHGDHTHEVAKLNFVPTAITPVEVSAHE